MSKSTHCVVVGGGIGGLTAALCLLHKGFDVDVYERSSEITEVGAGLHLSPNGTRILFSLGLKGALDRCAETVQQKRLYLWNTGQSWEVPDQGATAVDRYGAPFLLIHRADMVQMLADAVRKLKKDAIHLEAQAVDFDQDERGVRLKLANGDMVSGDVLVGADGIHSVIRRALFDAPKATFTGQVRWRGLIPMENIPTELRTVFGSWTGPGSNVTVYPVRRGTLMNFVGSVSGDWQSESWTEQGTHAECAARFDGWHKTVRDFIRDIRIPYKWGMFLHAPMPQWSKGRVTLLGDACHPTLPSLGQGANMAIEDGWILARCLEAWGDIDTALLKYEKTRVARAAAVVDQSWQQVKRRDNAALAAPDTAERYVATLWADENIKDWYDWIYEYDADAVAV